MRSTREPPESTLSGEAPQTPAPAAGKTGTGPGTARTLARYLVMPTLLGTVCLGLYLWLGTLDLDSIERRSINRELIFRSLVRHLEITAAATLTILALAVTAGVILTRPAFRRIGSYTAAVASTGQAIPSIGVLISIAILLDQFGFKVARSWPSSSTPSCR